MDRKGKIAVTVTILVVLLVGLGVGFFSDSGTESIEAKVIGFDQFDNAVFNLTMDDFATIDAGLGDDVCVTIGSDTVPAIICKNYNSIASFEGFLLMNDSGAHFGFFNFVLGKMIDVKIGDTATFTKAGRNPYVDKIPNYSKDISDDPSGFPSSDVFANFRAVNIGDITPNTVYRSASPWNSGVRAEYADGLYEEYGVDYLLCLNMVYDDAEQYAKMHPEYYVSKLFEEGKVTCESFSPQVHGNPEQTREFIDMYLETDGTIGIFCKLGRDRTGIYCAILEGLAGATYQEVRDDFMVTVCNYHHLEEGSEEYETVASMFIDRDLYMLDHFEEIRNIRDIDWRSIDYEEYDPEEEFTSYLIDYAGVEPEKVQLVKEKLRGEA